MQNSSSVLLILFTDDFYKCYYALNLACTYSSCNKNVTVFFSGYACNFLKVNWESYDKLKINKKIAKKKMTSFLEVLKLCKELKVKFFFCSTAVEFLNIESKDLNKDFILEPTPLYHIVNRHKNSQTIFI